VDWLLVFLTILFACFTESLTGFGLALVSMPLLAPALGLSTAAPLISIIALMTEIALLFRFRSALNLGVVWRLIAASMVAAPIGVLALRRLDEALVLGVLGAVIGGYALYGLLNLRLPALNRPAWAYLAGFLGGLLGGAYNTSGPPVVIYGHCRRWPPAEFKGNLQSFFLANSLIVLSSHLLAGNFTATVWRNWLIALPGLAVGIAAGLSVDRWVNPLAFRKIILALLLVLGMRLALGAVLDV
jgi:uncharacterized membrane protein YfcA